MIVYLDMDGVLVDFISGVLKHTNLDNYQCAPDVWDILSDIGINLDELDHDFWSNLSWMHDGIEILSLIEQRFDNISILTTLSKHPGSLTGKSQWISLNAPKYIDKHNFSHQKEEFAHSGALLIDDKNENVDKFIKAGGKAILVPRRWNRLHELSTMDYLIQEVGCYAP